MQAFLIGFASLVIGGGVAGAAIVGVVHSQTAPPAHSPANANAPALTDYGQ